MRGVHLRHYKFRSESQKMTPNTRSNSASPNNHWARALAVSLPLLAHSIAAGGLEDPTDQSDPLTSTESPIDIDSSLDLDGSVDLLFQDFTIVISASRSEQSSNMAPVPVSILSADDIHYSGVSELPALFAFIPGFDALRLDKNRWALGVRGLHQTFSDRTLFLIDGRNASNPLHGGVDFQTLPIFLEDIKQVETVRGPGGAAWGANAFNGVVNVINKDPRETTGVLLSQRINETGDLKSNIRIGDANEKFAWRFSAELNNVDSTDTDYVFTGVASAPSRPSDFLNSQRFKLDASYDFDDDTTLTFGLGGSHVERGDSPFLAQQLGIDERLDLIRSYAKLSKEFDSGAKGYIQWYGTYQDVNRPSMFRYSAYDNNIDGQYSFEPSNGHAFTVGGTLRIINLNISDSRPTDALPPGTSGEQWAGVFVGDRWTINDDWTLESQLRTDWYSETTLDWSGRIALLRTMGEDDEHVFRIALAKAFRTPQTALRDLSSERIALGGGLFAVNLVPAGDIDNEELYSFELGYTGKLADGLTLRADTYLQYYQDLSGIIFLDEPAPVVGRRFFTIDNIGEAKAWGFETELKYTHENLTISAWYAYNDFEYTLSSQNARAFEPAKNKAGITARLKANEWLTLNANYRYTDTTEDDFTTRVKASNRLDLTATFAPVDWNAEIQIGVIDVFDQTDLLIFDQTATGIAQETPGQTFFMQLQYTF